MLVKQYQEVTIFFPEEFELTKDFDSDPEWKMVSLGTVTVTYRKKLQEANFKPKLKEKQE